MYIEYSRPGVHNYISSSKVRVCVTVYATVRGGCGMNVLSIVAMDDFLSL